MRAYRIQIAKADVINMNEIARLVVDMPTHRFWVSEERAAIVVSALINGRKLPHNMRNSKREMFLEIYRRVMLLRKHNPLAPVSRLVALVVRSPAPKFYMLPRSAMDIIYKMKNGYYERIYADNPFYCPKNID